MLALLDVSGVLLHEDPNLRRQRHVRVHRGQRLFRIGILKQVCPYLGSSFDRQFLVRTLVRMVEATEHPIPTSTSPLGADSMVKCRAARPHEEGLGRAASVLQESFFPTRSLRLTHLGPDIHTKF